MSKPGLGRGLGALLGGGTKVTPSPDPTSAATESLSGSSSASLVGTTVRKVALDRIFPSPLQPRKDFAEESLRELADSIREQGIVQPLIVRRSGEDFELIAGERRWRAARLAGLSEAPIFERLATDRELLELALIENLQRENLNPIEEAVGYSRLAAQFDLTQEQIAQKVGRGRVVVANALRLLKLTPAVQERVRAGALSVGHAKVLLGLTDPGWQERFASRVAGEGLSVRQLEELVARRTGPKPGKSALPPGTASRDPHVVDLENRLRERFATKVALKYADGAGSLELRFASDAELNRLLELLGLQPD